MRKPMWLGMLAAVAWGATAVAQVPSTFTNLQVIPKDIAQRPLIDMMRGFVFALDVRCEHCHVGEGNDLSKFDFAADTKPTKLTARRMLKMLAAINADVATVGEPSAQPKVTCYSCHRGALRPALTPPGRGGPPPGTALTPVRR